MSTDGIDGGPGALDGLAEELAESPNGFLRAHLVDTRPLAIRPYRRLLIGQGTAFIGSMLTQVAVPVQVYDLSHSSLTVGFVGLVGLLPIVVFGLYGGAIADAMDRRLLYFFSSIGTWLVTLALLAQTIFNVRSVPLILALVAIQSAAFAIASATRGAIIPRIVTADLVPAANTLNFTVGNIGQVIGPLIAGVLVGLTHGFEWAYGIDGVLFTVALYSALRLPSIPPDGTLTKAGFRSVIDGLKFIAVRPVLVMSFGVDIAAMVLAMPRSLYPQVAADRFHGDVGPLYAAIAIGAVIAGVQQRLDRPGPASGPRPGRRDHHVGRHGRAGRARALVVVGGGVAGPRRSRRPGQRGVPADDPAGVRARPDARPHAGGVHRGRGRRPAARRSAGRGHGLGHVGHLLVGRRRTAVRGGRPDPGTARPAVLELRRPPSGRPRLR